MTYLSSRHVSELFEVMKNNPNPSQTKIRDLARTWHVKQDTVKWWIARRRESIGLSEDDYDSKNTNSHTIVEFQTNKTELEKKCDLSVTNKFSNMTTTKPYPKKAFKQQTIKSFFLRSPSHTIDKSKKNFQKFDASADYSGKQWQPTVFIRRLNLKCDTSGCPSCQNSA